jgi:ankyrin repeat protein
MRVWGILCAAAGLFVLGVTGLYAEEPSDRFYQAIRNNDIAGLRGLVKTAEVNQRDKRGSTPLMYAAAFGNVESMKLLIDSGADVNVKNAFDATALMWCAHDVDKVRLLLSKGANVNVRSKQGNTALIIAAADGASDVVKLLIDKGADLSTADAPRVPKRMDIPNALIAAAYANDFTTVKLLLEKGADVNAKDETGITALMNAAAEDNPEMVKLMLARGADVNAVSTKTAGSVVKNGQINLGLYTPLIMAATYAGPETIKILLDHGAKVNAQDVRGMTPLMLAIASDRPKAPVIRLLLDKGADTKIKDGYGQTAADWARKFQNPPVMQSLAMAGEARVETKPAIDRPVPDIRSSLTKSISMLQRVNANFMNTGGCFSCHSQNLTALAVSAARASGVHVDEAVAAQQVKSMTLFMASLEQPLLQRGDPPGAPDTLEYAMLHMAADGYPADRTTDAIVHNLAAEQHAGGNWHNESLARPPIQDGDFTRTATAIRCLRVYGFAGRKDEFEQRIERAVSWLRSATPVSTEDRNMQLLGIKWAGADISSVTAQLSSLKMQQRPDGGWAQTPNLASDAYATGEVLFTMHEFGIPASDPSFRRGVEYLLRTQLDDGSWHVRSRAPKFQPYFQSGFPHDHDQWISAAGTAWAAMGLAYAAGDTGRPATVAAANR